MYRTYFQLRDSKYQTQEGFEITTDLLMNNPHEILEKSGWIDTKLPLVVEKLATKLKEKEVKIKFGLEQQNHIETIESILSDLGSNEYSWQKIGKEIGWDSNTACYHYVRYLHEKWKIPANGELPLEKKDVIFISSEDKKYIGTYENEMFRVRFSGVELVFSTVKTWSYFRLPNKA